MFDNKKLSDLKLGDVSGLALFITGCFLIPWFMPIFAIGYLWFSWLRHKDKHLAERRKIEREERAATHGNGPN